MSNNHSTLEVQPTPAEARPPQQQSTMEPPPYAAEDPRVSQTTHSCSSDAQRLKLSQIQTANLTADECIAHLKLLSAFADLRIAISASEGLFGLYESPFLDCDAPENEKRNAAAQVREKRWAVYVSRAASRFETWFLNSLVDGPGRAQGLTTLWDVEENPDYETFPKWTKRVRWTVDLLPPLGEQDASSEYYLHKLKWTFY